MRYYMQNNCSGGPTSSSKAIVMVQQQNGSFSHATRIWTNICCLTLLLLVERCLSDWLNRDRQRDGPSGGDHGRSNRSSPVGYDSRDRRR